MARIHIIIPDDLHDDLRRKKINDKKTIEKIIIEALKREVSNDRSLCEQYQ